MQIGTLKFKLLLGVLSTALVGVSSVSAGTISNLSLNLDGLTATASSTSEMQFAESRHGPIAIPGNITQNLNRIDGVASVGNATGLKIKFRSDQDSICEVLKGDIASGSFSANEFAFDGEVIMNRGNIISGFLRFTSLSDNAVVELLVGANGQLISNPAEGSYVLRNDRSEGTVSSSTLDGIDVSLWSAQPSAANFLAVRFAPGAESLNDTNVDLNINLSVAVVPLPGAFLGGGVLLAGCAGVSRLKRLFRR